MPDEEFVVVAIRIMVCNNDRRKQLCVIFARAISQKETILCVCVCVFFFSFGGVCDSCEDYNVVAIRMLAHND